MRNVVFAINQACHLVVRRRLLLFPPQCHLDGIPFPSDPPIVGAPVAEYASGPALPVGFVPIEIRFADRLHFGPRETEHVRDDDGRFEHGDGDRIRGID